MIEEKNIPGESHKPQAASDKANHHSEDKGQHSEPEKKTTTSHQPAISNPVQAGAQPVGQQTITETMEVHKHPRNLTHKKKWSEYLLEFFMIFFAVMLGFLAENTREHIVEHKRAKEFIASMIDDLKKDTANFQQTYLVNEFTMQKMDSLISLLKSGNYNGQTSRLYYLARTIAGLNQPFNSTDRTFNQMKSSGNLRLITNHEIADSITSYYFKIDQLDFISNLWLNAQDDYVKRISAVFDASIFQEMHKDMRAHASKRLSLPNSTGPLLMSEPSGNPSLADNTAQSIAALVGSTHFLYTRTYGMQSLALRARASAASLIDLLQRRYHLQGD